MKQARAIRDLTFRYLQSMSEPPAQASEKARAGATVARLVDAWDTALDRLRVLNNRPLPGQLRPESPRRKLVLLC
jgi:urease gamma subunit